MSAARFNRLQDWLAWQEMLHPRAIDLGLERVGAVAQRLSCLRPAPVVISIAGTNGKGSSLALLEAILLRAGYRVGAYSSPHLLRYNERIRIDGHTIDDPSLCAAFARVDSARQDSSLTYFEFGTLAALDIMSGRELDVALLEVGLGGRLDAVNVVDADAALITSIGLDHIEWLGPDRDSIGREKAGIMRRGRPAVCAEPDPPAGLLQAAAQCGADLSLAGRDFSFSAGASAWRWWSDGREWPDLPPPALAGAHQLVNAAGVLAVLAALPLRLPRAALETGLRTARLAGRIQRIEGEVEQVLDVSHNAQAAAALAETLRRMLPRGRCHAVIGMMKDKDAAAFVRALQDCVQYWYVTGLAVGRASAPETLAATIRAVTGQAPVAVEDDMAQARSALRTQARAGDRILVCGSFHTVAQWSELKFE